MGLTYGIPRLSPRRIKIAASKTANTGVSFDNLLLKFKLTNFPKTETANIAGKVPKPNNAMNNTPFIIPPAAIAPANPI